MSSILKILGFSTDDETEESPESRKKKERRKSVGSLLRVSVVGVEWTSTAPVPIPSVTATSVVAADADSKAPSAHKPAEASKTDVESEEKLRHTPSCSLLGAKSSLQTASDVLTATGSSSSFKSVSAFDGLGTDSKMPDICPLPSESTVETVTSTSPIATVSATESVTESVTVASSVTTATDATEDSALDTSHSPVHSCAIDTSIALPSPQSQYHVSHEIALSYLDESWKLSKTLDDFCQLFDDMCANVSVDMIPPLPLTFPFVVQRMSSSAPPQLIRGSSFPTERLHSTEHRKGSGIQKPNSQLMSCKFPHSTETATVVTSIPAPTAASSMRSSVTRQKSADDSIVSSSLDLSSITSTMSLGSWFKMKKRKKSSTPKAAADAKRKKGAPFLVSSPASQSHSSLISARRMEDMSRRTEELSELTHGSQSGTGERLRLDHAFARIVESVSDSPFDRLLRDTLDTWLQNLCQLEELLLTGALSSFLEFKYSFELGKWGHELQQKLKSEDGVSSGLRQLSATGGILVKGETSSSRLLRLSTASSVGSVADSSRLAPVGLANFQKLCVIGKGAFGKVYLIRNKEKDLDGGGSVESSGRRQQIYAMKELKKEYVIKRSQVDHTKSERKVLEMVRAHPFVVTLHYSFQTADKLYFIMDYCSGGELFFHLGKCHKFDENRSKFYTAEITDALCYLHSMDVIYRDLKPENVLLDGLGHVMLTDFGLCKAGMSSGRRRTRGRDVKSKTAISSTTKSVASRSAATGEDSKSAELTPALDCYSLDEMEFEEVLTYSFCGTPEYLAPEILRRVGHSKPSDWWSLGALLYEMRTGMPPFYAKSRDKLFDQILHSKLRFPRNFSRECCSMLACLMNRNPYKRITSEKIKTHPFFADIEWKELRARKIKPPFVPSQKKSSKKSKPLAAASKRGEKLSVLGLENFDNEFVAMALDSEEDRPGTSRMASRLLGGAKRRRAKKKKYHIDFEGFYFNCEDQKAP